MGLGMTEQTMSSRERVLTALSRRMPDRVPKNIRMVAALTEEVRKAIGTKDIDGHFGVDMRFAPFLADHPKPDVTPYLGVLPEKASVSLSSQVKDPCSRSLRRTWVPPGAVGGRGASCA